MSTLLSVLSKRLVGLRRNHDGSFQSQCPVCAAEGGDRKKEHLRVFVGGAFNCVVDNSASHNKAIRAFIWDGVDPELLDEINIFTDPEPKVDRDPVYPEEWLGSLIQDHTYWINRGISEDVLRRLEGGLASTEERNELSGRYIFPVRHHQTRRLMGFSGRLVYGSSFAPPWKHIVKVSRTIYPLTAVEVSIREARKVVLTESIGDQLSLQSVGIDCTLTLLGLNLHSHMLGYLVSANLDQVIISTNNDTLGKQKSKQAGNRAADRLADKLSMYLGEDRVRIRLPESRKDWNDVLRENPAELDAFRGELGL